MCTYHLTYILAIFFAEVLVASRQEHQVDLVGPAAKDYRWQAREQNGYVLANFSIDWERQQATCRAPDIFTPRFPC